MSVVSSPIAIPVSALIIGLVALSAATVRQADANTSEDTAPAVVTPSADAARGEILFQPCASCHNVGEKARAKIGPALTGIVGRRIGSSRDYDYSPAIKKAGARKARWTTESLNAYLKQPAKFAPGNKMAFAGVSSAADRRDLVAYLGSLTLLPEKNPLDPKQRVTEPDDATSPSAP